jgi:hypothetical protein
VLEIWDFICDPEIDFLNLRDHTNHFPWLIRDVFFFTGLFLFIWLWINPRLIFQNLEPVFFRGAGFFMTTVTAPGGLSDYVAALIAQFYLIPWAGSLLITLQLICVAWLSKSALQKILKSSVRSFYLLPSILLLILHTRYQVTPVTTVEVLIFCIGLNFYLNRAESRARLRVLSVLLICGILYLTASGALIVFAVSCAGFEITNRKSPWKIRLPFFAGCLLAGLLIPVLVYELFYIGPIKEIFSGILPFRSGTFLVIEACLWLFFPAVVIIRNIMPDRIQPVTGTGWSRIMWIPFRRFTGKYRLWTQTAIIVIGTGAALLPALNRTGRTLMLIDYDAQYGRWTQILTRVQQHPVNNESVNIQINRAMAHMGILAEDLFSFPQLYGIHGLFPTDSVSLISRIQTSDFWFELGHLNYSLRWAYEDVSMHGETRRNLQRIEEINLIKGNEAHAGIARSKMNQTILNKSWIESKSADRNEMPSGKKLNRIREKMPQNDFIILNTEPQLELIALLENHPDNQMAFEYLMAYFLLSNQLVDFIKNLYRIEPFNYSHLPRHFEEAILLFKMLNKESPVDLSQYKIRASTVRRFLDFDQNLKQAGSDRSMLPQLLARSRAKNTSWFYALMMQLK